MDISPKKEKTLKLSLIFLGVSLILFLFNFFPLKNLISQPVSVLFDPVFFTGGKTADSLLENINFITEIGELRSEYDKLQSKYDDKSAQLSGLSLIVEENNDLREALNLIGGERVLVETQVLNLSADGYMIINRGSAHKVEVSDIVVSGNRYIGVVDSISQTSSVVRLPVSERSSLQVSIYRGLDEETVAIDKLQSLGGRVASAVVIAKEGRLKIENIDADSGVKNGDVVVISDEKVGSYLLLGEISGLETDPAVSYLTAEVSLFQSYGELDNIFVLTE
jgi:cell shape-determining protein MreC